MRLVILFDHSSDQIIYCISSLIPLRKTSSIFYTNSLASISASATIRRHTALSARTLSVMRLFR
jgi:hypothetical protein